MAQHLTQTEPRTIYFAFIPSTVTSTRRLGWKHSISAALDLAPAQSASVTFSWLSPKPWGADAIARDPLGHQLVAHGVGTPIGEILVE